LYLSLKILNATANSCTEISQKAFKHLIDNPAIGELPIFGGMFKNAKNAKKVLDTLRNVEKVGNQYIR
jgi:hypothetical protein